MVSLAELIEYRSCVAKTKKSKKHGWFGLFNSNIFLLNVAVIVVVLHYHDVCHRYLGIRFENLKLVAHYVKQIERPISYQDLDWL